MTMSTGTQVQQIPVNGMLDPAKLVGNRYTMDFLRKVAKDGHEPIYLTYPNMYMAVTLSSDGVGLMTCVPVAGTSTFFNCGLTEAGSALLDD